MGGEGQDCDVVRDGLIWGGGTKKVWGGRKGRGIQESIQAFLVVVALPSSQPRGGLVMTSSHTHVPLSSYICK